MQVISAVIGGGEPSRILRILGGQIGVRYAVEFTAVADEVVELFSAQFSGLGEVGGPLIGGQSGADDFQALEVRSGDDLPVTLNELVGGHRLCRHEERLTDVVDRLKQYHM